MKHQDPAVRLEQNLSAPVNGAGYQTLGAPKSEESLSGLSEKRSLALRRSVAVVVMGCTTLTAACSNSNAKTPYTSMPRPSSGTEQTPKDSANIDIAGDSSNFGNKNLAPLCGFASVAAVRAVLQEDPTTPCQVYDNTHGAPLGTAASSWGGPIDTKNGILCKYYPNLSKDYSFEAIRSRAGVPQLAVDGYPAFILESDNQEEFVQIKDKTLDCVLEDANHTGETQPTRETRLNAFSLALTQRLAS